MKLVVVGQTPPPYNGQAKMIQVLVEGLSKSMEVHFVRMDFSDSVSSAGKFSFGKIIHLFGLIARTWKALGMYRERYLYYPPASPNLIPVLRDILFLLAVRPFCKGLILHFHAGGVSRYADQHPALRRFLMRAYGGMSLGIIQGDSCPDDPSYFKAKQKIIVPYGIDVDISEYIERQGDVIVLHILNVGIHTEEKGIFVLLDTANELVSQGVDFIIHSVGMWYSSDEEQRFLEQRQTYGLEARVICCGRKTGDNLWKEYAWADVLIFPTHYPWETMGIVQLEAMAYGLPVVASDWQGPKDVVLDGETGFLCRHDRPDVFADRLQQLAQNQDLRKRMGQAGFDRYRSFYTEECFTNRIVEALSCLP